MAFRVEDYSHNNRHYYMEETEYLELYFKNRIVNVNREEKTIRYIDNNLFLRIREVECNDLIDFIKYINKDLVVDLTRRNTVNLPEYIHTTKILKSTLKDCILEAEDGDDIYKILRAYNVRAKNRRIAQSKKDTFYLEDWYSSNLVPIDLDIVKQELENKVLRWEVINNKVTFWYTDEFGVLNMNSFFPAPRTSKEFKLKLEEIGLSINIRDNKLSTIDSICNIKLNVKLFKRALNTIKSWTSINTILAEYNRQVRQTITNHSDYIRNPETSTSRLLRNSLGDDLTKEIYYFIQKVSRPAIERYTDNANKDTFDMIRLRVSIPTEDCWRNNPQSEHLNMSRIEFIQKYKRQIIKVILSKIENNNTFKKYNITTNFLKLDRITLLTNSDLEVLFTLKELQSKEDNERCTETDI